MGWYVRINWVGSMGGIGGREDGDYNNILTPPHPPSFICCYGIGDANGIEIVIGSVGGGGKRGV